MSSLVFAVFIPHTREWAMLVFVLQFILYFMVYRRVALLRRHPVLRIPKRLARRFRGRQR